MPDLFRRIRFRRYRWVLLPAVLAALWLLGPRERLEGERFDPAQIGADIDAYLHARERAIPGIVRGTQKHVLWADPVARDKRPVAVVYVHGFSASLEEIRPVPDRVARALGANLYYTRLTGHARDAAAMAKASVPDWRRDMAEALEVGRRIGERVLVIATSHGGALTAWSLTDPELAEGVAGVVLVSPNFAIRAKGASLLTVPFARWVVPRVLGENRQFAPYNTLHARYWTERYPTSALLPLAATAAAARSAPLRRIDLPALFIFSDADTVVDASAIRAAAERWGGPTTLWQVDPGRGIDHAAHVLLGDILSPAMTDEGVRRILDWAASEGVVPEA